MIIVLAFFGWLLSLIMPEFYPDTKEGNKLQVIDKMYSAAKSCDDWISSIFFTFAKKTDCQEMEKYFQKYDNMRSVNVELSSSDNEKINFTYTIRDKALSLGKIKSSNSIVTSSNTGSYIIASSEQVDAVITVIRAYGYTCDNVNAMIPFTLSEGFNVTCNNYRYSYEIENKGGRWSVTVD